LSHTFYIANGDYAAYVLKEAIYEGLPKSRIICFREDLSQGPLYNADSLRLMTERLAYWDLQAIYLENIANHKQAGCMSIEEMDLPKAKDHVIIWLGSSIFDYLAMVYQSIYFHHKACTVSIIDLSKIDPTILNVAQMNSDDIIRSYEIRNTLAENDISSLQMIWDKAQKASIDSCFRKFENGEVVTVDEAYYDSLILHKISKNGTQLRDIITTLLEDTSVQITDAIIEIRVKKMQETGLLKISNDFIFKT
jgi:hypothetical protein